MYRLLFNLPYVILLSLIRKLKGKSQYFSEYRYHKRTFKKILEKSGFIVTDVVYDELMPPFNFGLVVDSPLKKYFRSTEGVEFKMNTFAIKVFKFFWRIHPALISGGIGFVCKKK